MKSTFPITITFCFLLLAAGIIACKKKATKVNPDYEGSWCHRDGKNYYVLTIDEKSQGVYREDAGSSTAKHREGTVRIKDNKLHVGLFFSITIEQEPTKFDSVVSERGCTGPHSWYMILRTDTFYRSIYN